MRKKVNDLDKYITKPEKLILSDEMYDSIVKILEKEPGDFPKLRKLLKDIKNEERTKEK